MIDLKTEIELQEIDMFLAKNERDKKSKEIFFNKLINRKINENQANFINYLNIVYEKKSIDLKNDDFSILSSVIEKNMTNYHIENNDYYSIIFPIFVFNFNSKNIDENIYLDIPEISNNNLIIHNKLFDTEFYLSDHNFLNYYHLNKNILNNKETRTNAKKQNNGLILFLSGFIKKKSSDKTELSKIYENIYNDDIIFKNIENSIKNSLNKHDADIDSTYVYKPLFFNKSNFKNKFINIYDLSILTETFKLINQESKVEIGFIYKENVVQIKEIFNNKVVAIIDIEVYNPDNAELKIKSIIELFKKREIKYHFKRVD